MQSLSRSLSVSMVIWLPLGNVSSVHTQCEWAWSWLSGRTYTISHIVINIQAREAIQISQPNLSKGGSLCSQSAARDLYKSTRLMTVLHQCYAQYNFSPTIVVLANIARTKILILVGFTSGCAHLQYKWSFSFGYVRMAFFPS